jgi:hypothetical protein
MALSSELISQFVKATKDDSSKDNNESTVYGTVKEYNGKKYVQLDGSDLLTPISSTTDTKADERVTVMIKNHTATVTGNISSPAARTDDVREIGSKISEFEVVIADKVDTKELNAERARIDNLVSENVIIRGELDANTANIKELTADSVKVNDTLTAHKADIEDLQAKNATIEGTLTAHKANIDDLTADNATINSTLNAHKANIDDLTADNATIKGNLTAAEANIEDLKANKLSATDADLKYANIDFTNINQAAVEKIFSDSGIIKDLIVSEGKITGELVGVTIKGDLIEGNTIVADKLVVKGSDGLYYKLNTDGVTTESEQTEYNSLNGTVIQAKSITATKIAVDDLVAFGATIGGFKLTENSIYSGVKSSVDNTTRGIYMDNEGQIAFGDGSNYLKCYKDTDGSYKLAISARSIKMGSSGKDVETAINEKTTINDVKNYVGSRGENLITNGTAMLGDNTNFPSMTYDGSDTYYAGGCFKVTGRSQVCTIEFIAIDPSQIYELSYYIKNSYDSSIIYDYIDCYDVDKIQIRSMHVMYVKGSLTTLAEDLKPGDTVIHVTDVSGFETTTPDYRKGVIFWNYTNSKGYTYPPETYSRNVYSNLWDDGSAIDKTNNTITLKKAWTGKTYPAGTYVSQKSDGGTFSYLNCYKTKKDEWIHKTGRINGVGKNGESHKFREGTAFIRVGWLFDYNGTISDGRVSKISTITLTQNVGKTDLDAVKSDINDVKADIDTVRDEITTLLRIESSRGTVFKSDKVATVLSVVLYHGKQRITDSATMKQVFGDKAYLQWKWQRLDDESFGVISSSDSRFGDNGFTFTLSPDDVDTKITFMCELMV